MDVASRLLGLGPEIARLKQVRGMFTAEALPYRISR
jgi:hypothetical protein